MTAKIKTLIALALSLSAITLTSCSFIALNYSLNEQKNKLQENLENAQNGEDEIVSEIIPDLPDEPEDSEEPENLPTEPVPSADEVVYEYINVTRNTKPDEPGLDFGDKFTSKFSIPQLKAESENVKTFNQKILALYPELAFETDFSEEPVPTACIYNYSYSYDVTDKAVVAVIITESLGFYYSEGYTRHICLYYDLKNDCEVTAHDYLDAAGIDSATIAENAAKTLYIMTAKGQILGSYDMSFTDEYIKLGDTILVSERDGYVTADFSGEYGYSLFEIPTEEIVFEKATAVANAHIYATPAPQAEVLAVLDEAAEVSVIAKAELAQGLQTIEFEEAFSWYAVEYGNVRGYILEHELEF